MSTTALVTGSTGGIGKEIARGLVRLGYDVILGVRDPVRGEQVRAELGAWRVLPLDVSSVRSIRAAAEAFPAERLDVLVNNAGAWFSDRRTSADGVELTFATNVLGPYLLTRLLAPRMADGSRVVNVASGFASDYDPSDLEWVRRRYDGVKAYSATKLALRMITWGQAARMPGIAVNAAAPGFVQTGFNANASGWKATFIGLSARLFAVTPEKGADTPLWVATAPELAGKTARYFEGRRDLESGHRDPAAIADLERRCDELASRRAPRTIDQPGANA
jgi:NAD(P)-dependent dehydrogenase (short-subunit alcohol dehydrogenase family)